ncbi:MAG TPA: TonB-dependent receptor, partial [Bryobacteraceae bacterium]|nr:TonB-dependent receptor [Bryobacteraceae bacterium]
MTRTYLWPSRTVWTKLPVRAGWPLILVLLPWIATGQTRPEPVRTTVTVIESIEAETPAVVTTMRPLEIAAQPGVNLDDRLRSIPGFSLFRRASSLVANPTTQGVSLRGLGSSGASRTLVLWDGVPLNDPFGGWIQWARISPAELDRVELSSTAATSVFGDRAMSGAIALFSQPARTFARLGYDIGNRDTHQVHAGGGRLWRNTGVTANVRAFTTDGYPTVRADRRGTFDTDANVRFVAANTRLDLIGVRSRLLLRADLLTEERDNGTVLTHNSTTTGTVTGTWSNAWTADNVSLMGYHTRGEYRASFSAIAADRNSERLTSLQTVPSDATGGALLWSHRRSRWNLVSGADAQRVAGVSTDRLFPTGLRVGGGSQTQTGAFVQTDWTTGALKTYAGARVHNAAGDEFVSPSLGFALGHGSLRARGSVFRAFRAPTLNELYRPFRVGNAETQANELLRPETLFGAEAGFDYNGEYAKVSVTFYRNGLDDLITNVTLSSTPTLIVRQRRNAAEALTRGIEVRSEWNWRQWTADASWLLADARFSTGERIPQVPRHSGSARLSWHNGPTLASLTMRAFSGQFEDDRNQFLLPGFTTVQLAWLRNIGRGVSLIAEADNLLNREY